MAKNWKIWEAGTAGGDVVWMIQDEKENDVARVYNKEDAEYILGLEKRCNGLYERINELENRLVYEENEHNKEYASLKKEVVQLTEALNFFERNEP